MDARTIAQRAIDSELTGNITLNDLREMTLAEGLIYWLKKPRIGRKTLKAIADILKIPDDCMIGYLHHRNYDLDS